jgi:NTE family protein
MENGLAHLKNQYSEFVKLFKTISESLDDKNRPIHGIIWVYLLVFISLNNGVAWGLNNADSLKQKRPTVGLVLSGGGARGFAYVGLLKVMQEVGLPVDFVGGSSIGAIVGGLYSLGYHPDTIAKLIRQEDWKMIMSNALDRNYLAYEEKLFNTRNLMTLPLKGNKFGLGMSLSGSLHVDLMLNRYFLTQPPVNEFQQLPVPFTCIGTDLITGESVELKSGNLPRAIRASMAIPGYFSKVYYQGRHLIDGGVVNNYPAREVKAMGADIIIGGDVQDIGTNDPDQLASIVELYDHIMGYSKAEANEVGRKLTDVFIRFDMKYGLLDFTEYDSIMALGERVAREHYDELKALADSLNAIEFKPVRCMIKMPPETIRIDRVQLKIADSAQELELGEVLKEWEGKDVVVKNIEEEVKRVYGSQNYGEVYHEVLQKDQKNHLILHIEDPKIGHLGAGIHYDSDYKGNLLLNLTYRHRRHKHAKLFADVTVGQAPRLNSLFIINKGRQPGFALETDLYTFALSQYTNGAKSNRWIFDNLGIGTYIPFEINNNFMVKAGARYDYFRFRQDIKIDTTMADPTFDSYGKLYLSFHRDTRDKVYFPTKGAELEIKGKYVFPFRNLPDVDAALMLSVRYEGNIQLGTQWLFRPGIFAGVTLEDKIPPVQHLFGLGGMNSRNYLDNHVSFAGLRFVERFGSQVGIMKFDWRYHPYTDLYLTALTHFGLIENSLSDLNHHKLIVGYGLQFSYDSFIGPVSVTVSSGNQQSGLNAFLNVGFWL